MDHNKLNLYELQKKGSWYCEPSMNKGGYLFILQSLTWDPGFGTKPRCRS